jgi:hypothetical protein
VRRSLQRQWKHSLASLALLVALGQAPTLAATINVGGACTLVHAINATNNDRTANGRCAKGRGADRIVLPANANIPVNTVNNYNFGPVGLPVIRQHLTIVGNGARVYRAPRARQRFTLMVAAATGPAYASLYIQNLKLGGGAPAARGPSSPHHVFVGVGGKL